MSKLNVSKQESSAGVQAWFTYFPYPVYQTGNVEGELGWIEKEGKKVGPKFDYHGSRRRSRCYESPLKHTQIALSFDRS